MSFAGIVRTLVAVGIARLRSMFVARLFAIPLSGVTTLSSAGAASGALAAGLPAGASAGMGCGLAWIEVVRATGWLPVVDAGVGMGDAVVVESSVISAGIWGSCVGDASAAATFSG